MSTNFDHISQIEPKIFDTAREAIEHALSSYWVEPVHCSTEFQEYILKTTIKATDFAQSGLVHYQLK